MANVTIPGLTYNGKPVFYDDGGAVVTPTPTPTPTPSQDPIVVSNPDGSRLISIPLFWGPPGSGNIKVLSKDFGGFHDKDIIVVKFTTPAMGSDSVGNISVGEYQSSAISRTGCLSTNPVTFDNALRGQGFFGQPAIALANTASVNFRVGSSLTNYPLLLPNTTYYFNVKNTNGVGGNVIIELIKPQGM